MSLSWQVNFDPMCLDTDTESRRVDADGTLRSKKFFDVWDVANM